MEGSIVMSGLMEIVSRIRQLSIQHISCLTRLKNEPTGNMSKNKNNSFIDELPGLYRELFGAECV